jgi:rubrerythrin
MSATTPTTFDEAMPFGDVRELFCGNCGYGIVIRRDPPECPMCRCDTWQDEPGLAHWN